MSYNKKGVNSAPRLESMNLTQKATKKLPHKKARPWQILGFLLPERHVPIMDTMNIVQVFISEIIFQLHSLEEFPVLKPYSYLLSFVSQ